MTSLEHANIWAITIYSLDQAGGFQISVETIAQHKHSKPLVLLSKYFDPSGEAHFPHLACAFRPSAIMYDAAQVTVVDSTFTHLISMRPHMLG